MKVTDPRVSLNWSFTRRRIIPYHNDHVTQIKKAERMRRENAMTLKRTFGVPEVEDMQTRPLVYARCDHRGFTMRNTVERLLTVEFMIAVSSKTGRVFTLRFEHDEETGKWKNPFVCRDGQPVQKVVAAINNWKPVDQITAEEAIPEFYNEIGNGN